MENTLQGYHLPGPETKARLYEDDHLTPGKMWSAVRRHFTPPIWEQWTSLYWVVGPSRLASSHLSTSF